MVVSRTRFARGTDAETKAPPAIPPSTNDAKATSQSRRARGASTASVGASISGGPCESVGGDGSGTEPLSQAGSPPATARSLGRSCCSSSRKRCCASSSPQMSASGPYARRRNAARSLASVDARGPPSIQPLCAHTARTRGAGPRASRRRRRGWSPRSFHRPNEKPPLSGGFLVAGVPGLEPRTTVPETAVLPITPYPKALTPRSCRRSSLDDCGAANKLSRFGHDRWATSAPSRRRVSALPSNSIDSNNGGEMRRPLNATRNGPNAILGFSSSPSIRAADRAD